MMAKRVRFQELLERHEREIYRFACRMVGNPDDASDVLQDTFLRAFKAYSRLPDDANHRAWLYRIASRQSLNHLRARKIRRAEPLDEALSVVDNNGGPESAVESRRLVRTLGNVLRELSSRQRAALLLKKYEGLSYDEVAEVLGTTQENARAHVYQAMKKVRVGLRPDAAVRRK